MEKSTVRLTGPLDPREGWAATRCPIARAMEAVGTRSAFLLLREAFYGTTRFDDFAERVGISQPVAAARLKELVDEGLLEREPYQRPGQRTRMQYRLTDKGADLFPALAALMQWGDRWLGPSGVELRHRDCGAEVQAELRCTEGHPLTVSDLDLVARPAKVREIAGHGGS
jgi:DNA-binding HxlR family transcriptional regulator